MKKLFLLIAIYSPWFFFGQSPIISTQNGKIEGTLTENGIQVYKGIPFAAPPTGNLRWMAPQPVENWEGIKKCTQWGPSPMQFKPAPFMYWSEEFLIPEEPISEDCLYLNVWTGTTSSSEKRPVLVYIYGGGFRSGGSGCPIYDGEAMAEKGVVFVTINYRVGVFGFFAHPELSAEAEYGASGNYALLDMIAALKWVQDNIDNFGGDPGNVTIAGQSAGAFGVSYLTASPLAKGLFHRAIAQSGGSFVEGPLRSGIALDEAEQQGVKYALEQLNCKSLAELRAKSAEEMLRAQGGMSGPIVDGYVLPKTNTSVYQSGNHNDVPLLLGWNGDDNVLWQPKSAEVFKTEFQDQFGELSDELRTYYPMNTEESAIQSQYDLNRDQTFAIQAYIWSKLNTQYSSSEVYVYNFNRKLPAYTPETDFGAFHSGEVVYAYDNLHTLDRPWEPTDQQIADLMSSYWVNFARSGNPNGSGLPQWEPFTNNQEKVLVIDEKTETKPLPTQEQLRVLEKYYH